MSKFKPGDLAHCISDAFYRANIPKPKAGNDPVVGLVYTVREVWEGCLFFEEIAGNEWCFEEFCFEHLIDIESIKQELEEEYYLSI